MSRNLLPLLGIFCVACSKQEPAPTTDYTHAADFTAAGSMQAKKPIMFSSTSPLVESNLCEWNFGDGVRLTDGRNVTHTYSKDSTYTVSLAVTSNGVARVHTEQITIATPDTLATIFAAVIGQYHLTKKHLYSYGFNGTASFVDTTQVCDVPVVASRNSQAMRIVSSLPELNSDFYFVSDLNPVYYGFYATTGGHYSGNSIEFRKGTDSIVFVQYVNSGAQPFLRATYYGVKK